MIDEFVNPRMEHVLTARQDQIHDDEVPGGDDDHEALACHLKAELAASLAADPIDADIRRHLTAAHREGLDWRTLYEDAVRSEAAARPLCLVPPAPFPGLLFERDDEVGGSSRDV